DRPAPGRAPAVRPLILANFATVVGGGEIGLDLLAEGLRRRGVSPIIVTPGRGPVGERFDRRVIPTAIGEGALALRSLAREADLVHTMGVRGMVTATLARTGRPLILHALIDLADPLDPLVGEVADLVVCNSAATATRFPGARRVEVVHNGVPEPVTPSRSLGLDPGRRHIGVIGRPAWWKGHLDLLPALEAIVAGRDDVDIVVAGRMGGEVADQVQDLADRSAGRILVLGWVPKMRNHLAELDLVVVPSLVEGFGRVAAEAMRAGVPVVARRAGGLPEVLEGVTDPWLPDDPTGWKDKILATLDRPPDRPKRLKELGARFSPDRYVDRMCSLYDELLSQGRPPD
ncbi:MAG TPA: glycosyltransferase family 4 protein, partial [Acidimicrobiales bacterium]